MLNIMADTKKTKSTDGDSEEKLPSTRLFSPDLEPDSITITADMMERDDLFPESDPEVEERLARIREMKARLGSPAESCGGADTSSVASGQFDDVETDSAHGGRPIPGGGGGGTRSSSSAERMASVSSPPLQDWAIPLPDGSDVMQARYASLDNLRDSPIPLPDVSGSATEPTCTSRSGSGVETSRNDGAADRQQFMSESAKTQRGETLSREKSAFSCENIKQQGRSKGVNRGIPNEEDEDDMEAFRGRVFYNSNLREPYTPGSYLASRDKYRNKTATDSDSAAKSKSESSQFSEHRESCSSKHRDDLVTDETSRLTTEGLSMRGDDLASRCEDFLMRNENLSRHSESFRDSQSEDTTKNHDYRSRDSLVKEVLAREARKRAPPPRLHIPESREHVVNTGEVEHEVPVGVVLDKGRLNAIRESLDSQYSSGSYSLRDYKNFVARNYGEDEAARIRDRTPQPFSPGPDTSYQPSYYVSDPTPTPSTRSSVEPDEGFAYRPGVERGFRDSYSTADTRQQESAQYRGYSNRGVGPIYEDPVYDQAYRRRHPDFSDSSKSYSSSARTAAEEEQARYVSDEQTRAYRSSSQPRREEREEYRQQKPYKRSYSDKSMGSRSSSYWQGEEQQSAEQRERSDRSSREGRDRKRWSLFDRPSLFERDGVYDLLDDLFDRGDDHKPDKWNLWARHSRLLRDDDFCRDFFTRDWDWPSSSSSRKSLFEDDDFFSDSGRRERRKSKTTKTETKETREEEGNGSGRVHRTSKTESVHSDVTSGAERRHEQSGNGAAGRGPAEERRPNADTHNRSAKMNEERNERYGQEANRTEQRSGGSYTSNQQSNSGESRGETGTSEEDFFDKDTLYYKDFDDLIRKFKDVKWKSAMESFKRKDEGKVKTDDCEYTCHHKCRQMVALDCISIQSGGDGGGGGGGSSRNNHNHNETSLVERTAKTKIYSDNTVIYSKRRSLGQQEEDDASLPSPGANRTSRTLDSRTGRDPPEDIFAALLRADGSYAPVPPIVPQTAWSTLRQVPQDSHQQQSSEAESSFMTDFADTYGSIRFDTVKTFIFEDDADLGYHTGENTSSSGAKAAAAAAAGGGRRVSVAQTPPGERTLTREDLKHRIESFNRDNQHGLLMTLREKTDTFQGFIRVYMNLMRPISMSLTARPPSIYDIITPDGSDSDVPYESDSQLTSFYLPKDTTKVIHITSDTTAQEVIRALLQKFRITDNPRKFALYERLDESPSKSSMRRLRDDECPLPLCLCWTAEGLNYHRFILQENDTGEIIWEAFSIPELENFLRILNREEDEYVDQVKAKFQLMKIQMLQHMKHLEQQRSPNKDHRTPVFV